MRSSVGWLILLVVIISPYSVNAQQWQVKPLLQSLKGSAYDLAFWREGLKSVSQVRFKSGMTNQYRPFFNMIVLEDGLDDGARRIRRIRDTHEVNMGTVAHESFHAYYENFVKYDPDSPLNQWMKARSQSLYWTIPSKRKQLTALNETTALFVGDIITAHLNSSKLIRRSFSRAHRQSCEALIGLAEKFWNDAWKTEIYGYYYRDTTLEYWSDTFRNLYKKARGKRIENEVGEPIFVDQKLESFDKDFLAAILFEGRMTRDFEESFADELESGSCAELPQYVAEAN